MCLLEDHIWHCESRSGSAQAEINRMGMMEWPKVELLRCLITTQQPHGLGGSIQRPGGVASLTIFRVIWGQGSNPKQETGA